MNKLYIMGSGGHGAVVAEIAQALGYEVAGFIDDNPARTGAVVLSWKVIGTRNEVPAGASLALGIGDNSARLKMLDYAESSGYDLPVLVHPSAVVSPSARLGAGTVVMAQAVVTARTETGRACILNTACSVDHDCVVGECVHIAPGVRLCGGVTVGDGTLIGVGSAVIPSINIGAGCTVGGGSVVVDDIPDRVRTYGNPARIRSAEK